MIYWRRGVSLFAHTHQQSVTIATYPERAVVIGIVPYEADSSVYICEKFGEDQSRHCGENNASYVRVFACVLRALTHALSANWPSHLSGGLTGPKFKKCLHDIEVSVRRRFAIFPFWNVTASTCRRPEPQNWWPCQRPLTEVHQILSRRNFSSTVLKMICNDFFGC